MVVALMLGREGSKGFPGKNTHPILGRPMMSYPLLAAKSTKLVDEIYVSTDSNNIKNIAQQYGAKIIDRPPELATKEALGEDAFTHGFRYISEQLGAPPDLMVLLFCNAPTILTKTIDDGITAVGHFRQYLNTVMQIGRMAEQGIKEDEETRQELLAEEL